VQANWARFSPGVPQPEASIRLCAQERRFFVAEAGEKHHADRKIVSIWWMPDQNSAARCSDPPFRARPALAEGKDADDPQLRFKKG